LPRYIRLQSSVACFVAASPHPPFDATAHAFFFLKRRQKICLNLLIKKKRIAQLINGKLGENRIGSRFGFVALCAGLPSPADSPWIKHAHHDGIEFCTTELCFAHSGNQCSCEYKTTSE
jgi:hypothetical protein